jgi:hypothetical protein
MSRCDWRAISADFVFDGAATHRNSVVVIEKIFESWSSRRSQVGVVTLLLARRAHMSDPSALLSC